MRDLGLSVCGSVKCIRFDLGVCTRAYICQPMASARRDKKSMARIVEYCVTAMQKLVDDSTAHCVHEYLDMNRAVVNKALSQSYAKLEASDKDVVESGPDVHDRLLIANIKRWQKRSTLK